MIAQIVLDLPIDGPFDYLIPEELLSKVTVGSRVKVSFGPRPQIGFVIGLLDKSEFSKLKPISSLSDSSAVFNGLDLNFARDFSAYYGCSLGEALATILRNKPDLKASVRREHTPAVSLYRCPPAAYADKIREIMEEYRRRYQDSVGNYCQFLVLVPDIFRAQTLAPALKGAVTIGTRSSVFEADGQYDCVIMVDEEDASYRQEQSPMYDTRQVLLARSVMYGFDAAFVAVSPSVELIALAREKKIRMVDEMQGKIPPARVIDLSIYKFIPGMISPPVRDSLEASLKTGKKSILLLNRRGSYRLTRCVDCGEVLKCGRCDSPLTFSRSEKIFLCPHCTYTMPGDTACPKCQKPSWRSQGIGVEQLQAELKKIFPQARVLAFEREKKKPAVVKSSLPDFDILIATQAVLRFQGKLQARTAAFIDFDAEINRLNPHSAFNAFSLAVHLGSMADEVFMQTRNHQHYVLQALAKSNAAIFYDEELKLRKEFGFSPFKHWISINCRARSEKSVQQAAQEVYNKLEELVPKETELLPPLALLRKRDQFRFNVILHAHDVPGTVALVKSALAKTKRPGRVIVNLSIDP